MSFFLTIISNSIVIYVFWTAPSIAPPQEFSLSIWLCLIFWLVWSSCPSLQPLGQEFLISQKKKLFKKKALLADKIYSVTTELKINAVLTECFRNF